MVQWPHDLDRKAGGMAKDVTLACSECGAEQTAPTTSGKWKGWRVLLDDYDKPPRGYRCPDCHRAHEPRGTA